MANERLGDYCRQVNGALAAPSLGRLEGKPGTGFPQRLSNAKSAGGEVQSGGDIWVYSEPGRGTTFKVYLPEATGGGSPSRATAITVQPPNGNETVLLVEDEPMVRQLVRLTLQEHGYRVLEAGQPDEALRLLEAHDSPLHLLMTDVVLPGMSGRELAARVTGL